MAVGLVSDITKMIKDEQAKQAGVKKWEDIILNPYQALAEAESEAVSTQTKYDISDAYANYKRAELGVMRNQNLGSGFKRQIASALQSEYEKQYETEKAEEASNIYNIGSKYSQEAQKQIAAQEKTLTEQASKLRKLEDYLIDYSGVDFSKATTPIEQGGLGYYALVEGGAPGQFEITNVGRDFFDKALHTYNAENKLFSDYLLETDPELYEYYGQNKAAFNKYIAGLDETDLSYSDLESLSRPIKSSTDIKNIFDVKRFVDNYENPVYRRSDGKIVENVTPKIKTANLLNDIEQSIARAGGSKKWTRQRILKELQESQNIETTIEKIKNDILEEYNKK